MRNLREGMRTAGRKVALDAGAHALITTPGATRFYRSELIAVFVQDVGKGLQPVE